MSAQYCQPSDIVLYALNGVALVNVPDPTQIACCVAASAMLDGYFNNRVALPLLAPYPADIIVNASYIAAYLVYSGSRGAMPMKGADEQIKKNYEAALEWARNVQRTNITPLWTPSIPVGQDPGHDAPQVVSDQKRGWQQYSRTGRPAGGGF